MHLRIISTRLDSAAALIHTKHLLTEWRIGMNLSRVQVALATLTTANNTLLMSPLRSLKERALPPGLAASPMGLKEAARSILEQRTLSPRKIAVLPPDLMVELATELAGETDSRLSARFQVQYWLDNPYEAEASGNDWSVAEDCDLLTTQLVDAWLVVRARAPAQQRMLQRQRMKQQQQQEGPQGALVLADLDDVPVDSDSSISPAPGRSLAADLDLSEQRRASELKSWAARIAWQQVMQRLPLLIFRYLAPSLVRAYLTVKRDAIDLLSKAAEQFLQPLVDMALKLPPITPPAPQLPPADLLSLLNHAGLTPILMRNLHAFPPLSSRAQLEEADDDEFRQICEGIASRDKGDFYFSRTGRVMVYHNSEPEEKPSLKPQLIDDCRSSMVTLTLRPASLAPAR